jgi:hypothetical protein
MVAPDGRVSISSDGQARSIHPITNPNNENNVNK